ALEEHLARCPHCMEKLEKLSYDDSLVEAMRTARHEDETRLVRVDSLIRQFKGLSGTQDTADWKGEAAPAGPYLFPFLAPARDAGELGWLGPYRICHLLGKGGMGMVFRAEDPRLKRQVAVKVIKPELLL